MDLSSISTGNPKIDHLVGLVGTMVTLASFLAGSLNSKIRSTMDTEGEVPPPFLWAALVLNYAAINLDKAAQMHKLLRGTPVVFMKVNHDSAPAKPEETKPASESAEK